MKPWELPEITRGTCRGLKDLRSQVGAPSSGAVVVSELDNEFMLPSRFRSIYVFIFLPADTNQMI